MQDQYVPKPDNNMAFAIFTTLCCCLPLGIVAIIKASKVNELYALQQYQAAENAAAEAKKYALIGLCVGLVINIISFIVNFAAMSNMSSLYNY